MDHGYRKLQPRAAHSEIRVRSDGDRIRHIYNRRRLRMVNTEVEVLASLLVE
jgi:hypothetical protein